MKNKPLTKSFQFEEEDHSTSWSPWATWVVGLVYFLTARLNIELTAQDSGASPAYIPAGLAIVLVILYGRVIWPGIAIGTLMIEGLLLVDSGQWASMTSTLLCLLSAAMSTWQALLCANWLKQRRTRPWDADELVFNLRTLLGIALRCLPAGLAGGLYISNLSPETTGIWGLMVTWISGNLLGMAIVLLTGHCIALMNQHHPLQWIRITLFLTTGGILLIGLQWIVSAFVQMPVGGEILVETLSMFMLGTLAGRNLHFQSAKVFLGLTGWMVLLIFGNEHIPLIQLAGGTLALCWAACWLGCIVGQKGHDQAHRKNGSKSESIPFLGYVSTVEGQHALKGPCLLLMGLTSIALLTYTFERMSLAARMDILGSRLTEQLE
ncbi:MAG: MASE1 domain-containing protein, partial [Verrucomicrobiota bacterium]|nr:MASE1 domain-containing protein [Verrucomicrobiota bacterium]